MLYAAFALLYIALRSTRAALLVMANLPLALIGGVVMIFLSGGTLSVASLVGFITLFGIATRNGIMLIKHYRHLMEEKGVRFRDAIAQGSMERLSPILMTALVTGVGLVPLALGAGEPGREIQQPMAVVILGGIVTSTFLNMIIIPVLLLVERMQITGDRRPAGDLLTHLLLLLLFCCFSIGPDRHVTSGAFYH
jgi:Cu/Ag efflux pump CusA